MCLWEYNFLVSYILSYFPHTHALFKLLRLPWKVPFGLQISIIPSSVRNLSDPDCSRLRLLQKELFLFFVFRVKFVDYQIKLKFQLDILFSHMCAVQHRPKNTHIQTYSHKRAVVNKTTMTLEKRALKRCTWKGYRCLRRRKWWTSIGRIKKKKNAEWRKGGIVIIETPFNQILA